ncbi:hypothetical protein C4D60_Mb09t16210 [Musa balbisiana]|uniref:Uncharacterized protein n=1 Tax=Musa balbisiana TaxID=52838 RepID=A0A4S8IGX1_MUSBA|nr:hypothetical protein C4D60_Mb09t16210 [Musa balbisiana]
MARWATVMQLFSLATYVGPVVEKITEKAVEGGVNGLQWVWANLEALFDVEAELDKLRRTAKRICAILKDAEETRFIEDQTVREWLADLKDFAFDVEDVVDEFQIGLDIAKLEKARLSPGSRKRRRPWDVLPPCLTWVYRKWTISVKIKEIKEKYEEIKQRRNDFQLREGESRRRQQDKTQQTPQHTGSLRGDSLVLGLEEKKKEILMHLRQGGGVLTYMRPRPLSIIWLNGLGENDSWLLFCSYAFRQAPTDHDVGREIGCNGRHNQKQKYKMPGLIYELAQSVSAHECLRIENDASFSESENARYALSCNFPVELPIFQKLYQNKKLRTFILLGENGTPTKQVPRDLYMNLRCLRVLDLRRNELTELPDSIGNLIHLRYLNLLDTQIERLPESLGSLYNLQLLELGDCKKLVELPRGLSNLINLRYLGLRLDWENCRHRWSDIVMPPGLGRMTSLHTLSRFSVSSESGGGISELKCLKLRGEICISKLEIVDVRDAMEASLGTKQHLETMMLRWTNCRSPASQSGGGKDVIEQLRPNSNLKNLWIENYKGAEFPSWLGDQSMNLETLRLYGCERSERLPPVGRLRNLKFLFLEGLHTVTDLGSLSGDGNFAGFPSLEMITISNLKNLERGFELVQDEMPCLRKLVISDCSNLLQLPQLPNSLEDIEIRECPALSTLPMLSSLQQLVLAKCGHAIIESIHQFTSLSSLTISQFPRLGSITREHLQDLRFLRKLKIDQCDNFVSLSSQHLVSLETLEISQCCTFSSLAGEGLPASLEDLRLQSCGNLTYLPGEGMPASLQHLAIGGCPTLEQRCQVGGGDWHKIQHIPRREIGENSTV